MKLDKKNTVLIFLVLLVGLISWQFTIKYTFAYKSEIDALNIEELTSKQREFERLGSQNKLLEKAITEKDISQSSIREVLFQATQTSESIQILNYNDEITVSDKNSVRRYYQIEVKGDYNELIKLLDKLLIQCPGASLVNFNFEYHKKNYRYKEYLSLEIVLSMNE